MYLKSIVMQGFKSFANKIELDFHDGITCIVGPNGSGKSNVADAVRWVLGEQSAKQLRGGNMQDVIFAGTETRKPLGYAMVMITFDNSDRTLAFDAEEVAVTRKLFRSGESEYRLNGRLCRLRDINELFFDTGIGKEGYSIIGQGQIDRILSGKPEDRRELFDEAAGIVKFKRRKAASIKKLEGEEQNLIRVRDILKELEDRKGPLGDQAEKAERYLVLREDLKHAELALFCRNEERVREQLSSANEALSVASGHQRRLEAEFDRTKQEYSRIEQELEELETRMRSIRETNAKDWMLRQQQENRIALLMEQIRSGQKSSESLNARIAAINDELESRRVEQEELAQEKADLLELQDEIKARKDESAKELEAVQEKIRTLSTDTEQNRSETISLLNQRSSIKEKLQRYDTMLEQIEQRKAELHSSLLQSAAELQTQGERTKELQEAHTKAAAGLEAAERELAQTTEQLAADKQAIDEGTRELTRVTSDYHRDESRLESLRNIAERYEGYGNSVRLIMGKKKEVPGIHGVIAELLTTEKQYETAIETALGGTMQNVVTKDDETAKQMIAFLKKGRYGRATFLPLTSVRAGRPFDREAALREEGVIGLASSLIRCDAIYKGIADSLLGRTLVVDTIDHAIAIGRAYHHQLRMVTLEGELLNPGGSMTGGAYRNSSNLLGRKRELTDLEKRVGEEQKKADSLRKTLEEKQNKQSALTTRAEQLREELKDLYLKENTARLELETWKDKNEELRQHEARTKAELSELARQTDEISKGKESLLSQLTRSQVEESRLTDAVQSAQDSLSRLSEQENGLRERHSAILLEFANANQKAEFLNDKTASAKREETRLKTEKHQLLADVQKEDDTAKEKQDEIEHLQDECEKLAHAIAEGETQITSCETKKEEMNRTHKTFFEKRDALTEERSEVDRECFRLNARIEKLTEENDQLIAELWENYEMTPDQTALPEDLAEVPAGELKKRAGSLRREIRELGSINVNAIDEYKELRKRYEFLSSQYEDIIKATDALRDIIKKLDVSMRRQFKEKFAEIQKEYNAAFRELFGGGAGTLELVEEEDVLDAGIIISAQPPGKKLQNMMQLSGGEKALTAIALLFAIQNLKPSPFCLLDEIEAALDDSNVSRYSEYLHKLTKNTQFIIITHRRGTMAAADRLYGITMQEKGVSALVSVKLIESELEQ